jgi:hypothetical protein
MGHAVDEYIEPLMPIANMIEQRGEPVGVGHIRREMVAADFKGNSLRVFFVARMDYHPRAFARKSAGNPQPDVMGRSGNQRDFFR